MSNTHASTQPIAVTPGPLGLLLTTVGLKATMAVTGAILVGFVLMHFIGNALVFMGTIRTGSCGWRGLYCWALWCCTSALR